MRFKVGVRAEMSEDWIYIFESGLYKHVHKKV